MSFSSKKLRIIIALIVLLAGAGVYWMMHMNEESTDDAQVDATVVTVSPKVAGYVKAIYIDDNTRVKAGDVLLEIDPTDYEIRRDKASADLEGAQAAMAVAGVNQDKANRDLKRVQALGKLASSQQQVDNAETTAQMAIAGLAYAKSKLLAAQNDLAQAEKDLKDTKLVASVDGKITKGNIELGNYIQPGQQLASLVAQDFWVVANFKENQLAHMRKGQIVDIDIDAFPDKTFHGKIDSFQSGTGARFSAFPAENATGNFVKIVQRVPVKVLFDKAPDPSLALGPGMSVIATAHTK